MRAARVPARPFAGLGPAGSDWPHARRVAIGLLVPGLALLLAGRPDLLIYAVFGSFTGMYGRAESPGLRLRHQTQAGTVLSAGVAIGIALSACHARPWVLVSTEAVFAVVVALVTNRLGLSPRGPFFGIFALGAVATVPAGRIAPWAALAICVATAAFCVLIGLSERLSGTRKPVPGEAVAEPARCEARCARRRRPWCALTHAARYGLAIAAAGSIGLLLGVDHANWAMASAAVPLAAADARNSLHPGIRSVVRRGAHRVLGTLAGLGAAALLLLPPFGPTPLALSVMVLLFPTELFMARNYGLALGFFTPLIMVMTELATPAEPLTLLTDRGLDTLLGVAAGIAAAVLVRGPCSPRLRRRDGR
ncbi:FUSC family protein [Amycolatopsis samaneae]|uniref:FUSC family protein n=1 Tax=Amycolatopsis samaneae TaxID=664691 RepID=A0ABW5GV91_9PSEU